MTTPGTNPPANDGHGGSTRDAEPPGQHEDYRLPPLVTPNASPPVPVQHSEPERLDPETGEVE